MDIVLLSLSLVVKFAELFSMRFDNNPDIANIFIASNRTSPSLTTAFFNEISEYYLVVFIFGLFIYLHFHVKEDGDCFRLAHILICIIELRRWRI